MKDRNPRVLLLVVFIIGIAFVIAQHATTVPLWITTIVCIVEIVLATVFIVLTIRKLKK